MIYMIEKNNSFSKTELNKWSAIEIGENLSKRLFMVDRIG